MSSLIRHYPACPGNLTLYLLSSKMDYPDKPGNDGFWRAV
jgi:hypothetical protein